MQTPRTKECAKSLQQPLSMSHYAIFCLCSQDLCCHFFLQSCGVSSGIWIWTCLVVCVIVYELPNQGSWHTKSPILFQVLPQAKLPLFVKLRMILRTYINYSSTTKKTKRKIKRITIPIKSFQMYSMFTKSMLWSLGQAVLTALTFASLCLILFPIQPQVNSSTVRSRWTRL